MRLLDRVEIIDGIGQFRPRCECTLVEAVKLIGGVIDYCRGHRIAKLLVNGTGLVGVSVPSLVDRFLLVEEWAQKANRQVAVALVVHAEYIHPEKFGVRVAADLGLVMDVYTSEAHALEWLASVDDPV